MWQSNCLELLDWSARQIVPVTLNHSRAVGRRTCLPAVFTTSHGWRLPY
jgi:hypothetical protein